ncbi:MAG: M13 family metallopeptidase [Chlorobi bacterium]|nr:M13 family metallopeptidase [Chlorobiota bacterium]
MTKAIDPANMDMNYKPGNDFYRYVNGGWMAANPIPPEYSQYGAFNVLFDQNQEKLKELVDEVSKDKNAETGSVSQQIRDFFNSGMDTVQIEKLGLDAIRKDLNTINSLKTKKDIQHHIAEMQKEGIYPLFYFFADADQKNSSMEIANFYQGGLGMPDVEYYTGKDNRNKQLRKDYVSYVTRMFMLAGEDEKTAEADAKKIMDIETALAGISKTRTERRDAEKNYYKTGLRGLKEISPAFDWQGYFTALGLPEPGDINLSQKDFIAGISPLMDKYSVDDWKVYLTWNLLNKSANYLSDDFVNEHFEFYGKTLSGQQELKPRWKRVMNTTSKGLGEAIGQLYVEKYFPAESKKRMIRLVENLRKAFAERIRNLDWMSDETKKQALAKLDAITVKIGYPDKWKDYSKLKVTPENYLQNVRNASKLEFNRNLAKIGKPVDKTEWGMTPQTVNAYYNPSNNEIVFPAGILQPPFFNADADDAVNYGAIGVVIGHEMTHGFDDQGRKYDKDGNMNDWWTVEDAKRFEEKTKILSKQYDQYTLLDSLHVNGKLTMGENIADLGGLNIAWDAFKMSLNGKEPETIDGFTGDQRFFMGYAQVWRQNIRDKELMRRLKEDVHSPGEARVNVPVFNLDVFLAAFRISPEDRLYIPKEERAYIW